MIMSPNTRKSVKMVAELRNGTASRIPDTDGRGDYSAVAKAFMVVEANPLSLIALKPPSEFGINAVMSWMQRFGVPMWARSPAVVYLATSLEQVRRVPGRPSGESLDRLGNPTLQTREQHIRGTQHHRTDGLKTIAKRVELAKLDTALYDILVTFDVSTLSSADLVKTLIPKHIDEMHYTEDVHAIITALKDAGVNDTARLPRHSRERNYTCSSTSSTSYTQ